MTTSDRRFLVGSASTKSHPPSDQRAEIPGPVSERRKAIGGRDHDPSWQAPPTGDEAHLGRRDRVRAAAHPADAIVRPAQPHLPRLCAIATGLGRQGTARVLRRNRQGRAGEACVPSRRPRLGRGRTRRRSASRASGALQGGEADAARARRPPSPPARPGRAPHPRSRSTASAATGGSTSGPTRRSARRASGAAGCRSR